MGVKDRDFCYNVLNFPVCNYSDTGYSPSSESKIAKFICPECGCETIFDLIQGEYDSKFYENWWTANKDLPILTVKPPPLDVGI